MTTEQLPHTLKRACEILDAGGNRYDAQQVRNEHAQRLTLQHHAADMAQRVADLEAERDEARSMFYASCQASAAFAVALGLDETENDPPNISDAIDELKAERATTAAHIASIARQLGDDSLQVDDISVRVLGLVAERGDLRAKHDELLVALHGIGRALGLAEGERSPHSITCGVLERVNRLAKIEAQEPSMYVLRSTATRPQPAVVKRPRYVSAAIGDLVDMGLDHLDPLFANPVPAQAVPDGWRLVPVNLTQEMRHAWDEAPANSDDDDVNMNVAYGAMIAAAPEAAR